MFSWISKRFTYANVVVTFALVFAMTGGAYAAQHYLITSTKQISPKVLKALTGKNGKNGTNGANGANGAQGSQGVPGANGKDGTSGTDGTNGVSVASKELTSNNSACNKEGGSEFTAEGKKTTVCNGKEGSPWTAGGTLPTGKSEEGEWTYFDSNATEGEKATAISFGIPLKTAPVAHFIGTTEGENEIEADWALAIKEHKCKGTADKPEAAEGNLCVFGSIVTGNNTPVVFWDPQTLIKGPEAAGTAGTAVDFGAAAGLVIVEGTWAVTGD